MKPLDFFPLEYTDLLDCYPRFLVETLLRPIVDDLAGDESFLRLRLFLNYGVETIIFGDLAFCRGVTLSVFDAFLLLLERNMSGVITRYLLP